MDLTVIADPDNRRVLVGPLVVALEADARGKKHGIAAEWCGHKFFIEVDKRDKAPYAKAAQQVKERIETLIKDLGPIERAALRAWNEGGPAPRKWHAPPKKDPPGQLSLFSTKEVTTYIE